MSDITLLVDGLNCSGCVGSVTKRLGEVAGVVEVSVDLVSGGTSTVHVGTDRAVPQQDLEAAITAAGKRIAAPAGV